MKYSKPITFGTQTKDKVLYDKPTLCTATVFTLGVYHVLSSILTCSILVQESILCGQERS